MLAVSYLQSTVDWEIFARKNIGLLSCFIFVALAYWKCSFVLII